MLLKIYYYDAKDDTPIDSICIREDSDASIWDSVKIYEGFWCELYNYRGILIMSGCLDDSIIEDIHVFKEALLCT